jgi:osmotically inducible protein OsmC
MPTREATAHWDKDIKRGSGRVRLQSGAFEGPYSFSSRFENAAGTNPEELLGAAHAGCFTMALSLALTNAGHAPASIDTVARVDLERTGDGFGITKIALETQADVPGLDAEAFQGFAQAAKSNCPLSKALASVPNITLQARLR